MPFDGNRRDKHRRDTVQQAGAMGGPWKKTTPDTALVPLRACGYRSIRPHSSTGPNRQSVPRRNQPVGDRNAFARGSMGVPG